MDKYEVFTPEMEFPEGMTDEQAWAICKAVEMRRFAYEFEWQMENDCDCNWAADAAGAIGDGEVTALELVEAAFEDYLNSETDFDRHFTNAVDSLTYS